jgi:hypothetical protein
MSNDIQWDQLIRQEKLNDGDRIAVQVTEGAVPPEKIQIMLQLGSNVTWWKGLEDSEIVLCQCQDTQDYSAAQLNYDEFKKRDFTFWKAKTFGAHTPMYHLANQNDFMKGGNSYLFEWLND